MMILTNECRILKKEFCIFNFEFKIQYSKILSRRKYTFPEKFYDRGEVCLEAVLKVWSANACFGRQSKR